MVGHRRQVWCDSCTTVFDVFAEDEDAVVGCPNCAKLTILVTCDACGTGSELMTPRPGQTHWICPACKVAEQFSAETLSHFYQQDPTATALVDTDNPPLPTPQRHQRNKTRLSVIPIALLVILIVGASISDAQNRRRKAQARLTQTATEVALIATATPAQLPTPTPHLVATALARFNAHSYAFTNQQIHDNATPLNTWLQQNKSSGTLRYMSYRRSTQVPSPVELSLATGDPTSLPNDRSTPNALPDDWVRFDDSSQVRLIRTLRQSLQNPTLSAQWAPDGVRIAFSSIDEWLGGHQVWIQNPRDDQPARQLLLGRTIDDYAWSPDSSQLLISSSTKGRAGLFVVNADGSDLTPVLGAPSAAQGTWLDDETVIYSAEENATTALFVHPLHLDYAIRLTVPHGNAVDPAVSPDGRFLAFAADWAETFDLYLFDLQDSTLYRMTTTDDKDERMPVWPRP